MSLTPVTRPFAYNTGSSIPGTEQHGNLAVGTPDSGFAATGLKWWNGPDENTGYVIAKQDPSGTHIGADGQTAYLGFNRSDSLTDASFIGLANDLTGQSFVDAATAKTWLNSNGYWTSYGLNNGGGSSIPGQWFLLNMYTPALQNGSITFPDHIEGIGGLNPNLVGQTDDSTYNVQLYINTNDSLGNDNSSLLSQLVGNAGTLTLAQGSNSVTYSFTNQAFVYTGNGSGGYPNNVFYDSEYGSAPQGSLVVTSPASGDFNTTDPISISFTI